jgi:hypothetical protein
MRWNPSGLSFFVVESEGSSGSSPQSCRDAEDYSGIMGNAGGQIRSALAGKKRSSTSHGVVTELILILLFRIKLFWRNFLDQRAVAIRSVMVHRTIQ